MFEKRQTNLTKFYCFKVIKKFNRFKIILKLFLKSSEKNCLNVLLISKRALKI